MATYNKNYRWKDLDINLEKHQNGDIKDQKDIDAVKNSIKNIFLTFQGSRRMVPDFAYGPYNLLFDPIDEETASQLGNMLFESIRQWDNRVIINKIHVEGVPTDNLYNLKLNISLRNIDDEAMNEVIIEEIIYAR